MMFSHLPVTRNHTVMANNETASRKEHGSCACLKLVLLGCRIYVSKDDTYMLMKTFHFSLFGTIICCNHWRLQTIFIQREMGGPGHFKGGFIKKCNGHSWKLHITATKQQQKYSILATLFYINHLQYAKNILELELPKPHPWQKIYIQNEGI